MSYNKTIYGEPKLSPTETIERLTSEKCFFAGVLRIYPQWLGAPEIFEAIEAGLLIQKNYPGLLNHTELRLSNAY